MNNDCGVESSPDSIHESESPFNRIVFIILLTSSLRTKRLIASPFKFLLHFEFIILIRFIK